MNLWDRLEERGRKVFNLDSTWLMYAADLKEGDEVEIKLAQRGEGERYLTHNDRIGIVNYFDLR